MTDVPADPPRATGAPSAPAAPRQHAGPAARVLAAMLSLAGLLAATGCETAPRVGPDPASGSQATKAAPDGKSLPQGNTAAAQAPSGPKKAYGDPLSATSPRVALADLLKTPSRFSDRTIRVEGKVSSVCQAKGCWLELEDEGGIAHVKLGAHRFFVPKSASGQHAVVEGRVFAQVDKGHCEQEAEEQTGKVAKVELDATGVELTAVR
jgi:hypothetical protein